MPIKGNNTAKGSGVSVLIFFNYFLNIFDFLIFFDFFTFFRFFRFFDFFDFLRFSRFLVDFSIFFQKKIMDKKYL